MGEKSFLIHSGVITSKKRRLCKVEKVRQLDRETKQISGGRREKKNLSRPSSTAVPTTAATAEPRKIRRIKFL